jgi:hypothetical protein
MLVIFGLLIRSVTNWYGLVLAHWEQRTLRIKAIAGDSLWRLHGGHEANSSVSGAAVP